MVVGLDTNDIDGWISHEIEEERHKRETQGNMTSIGTAAV
jgi:hypothetical protein